jgi:hypothetical protein
MYEQQRDQMTQTAFNVEQTHFMTQSMADTIVTVSIVGNLTREQVLNREACSGGILPRNIVR